MMKAETLRKSILQYAIQGKLVPQIGTEEPASILLEKIKKEKAELIKQGKIKKEKPLAVITNDEKPFDIPNSWEWVTVEDITQKNIKRGKSPRYVTLSDTLVFAQKCNVKLGGINLSLAQYLDESILSKYPQEEFMKNGDVVINSTGNGTMGRVGIFKDLDNPTTMLIVPDSHVTIVRASSYMNSYYVYCYLKHKQSYFENMGDGSTNQTELKPYAISSLRFPLPPLEEQQRIVDRIEELMLLVDEYEKKEIELAKLEKEFPEKLKKSVLQYAIQGKLVPQIESDENASILLKKIKAEKAELVKQGKIKKPKPLPLITDEEKPFDIPDSWEWVRLGDLCNKLTDGAHHTPKYIEKGVHFLSVKDVSSGKINFSGTRFISHEEHAKLYQRCNPQKGDLLLTKVGTTGIPIIVDTDVEFSLFVSVALLKVSNNFLNLEYLCNLIKSPHVHTQSQENTKGVGNKNWVMRDIANTLVPLPPLAEQQRIVARIEELFVLIGVLANGEKLPKTQQLKQPVDNIIELPLTPAEKPKVDVQSFGLVAREDGEVSQADIDSLLSEVQDFYDNKKN